MSKRGHVLAVMIRCARDFAAARAVFANSVILANQPPNPLCLRVSVVQIPCAAELLKLIGDGWVLHSVLRLR